MFSQRVEFVLTLKPVDDMGSLRLIAGRRQAVDRAVEALRRELLKQVQQGMGVTQWGPVTISDLSDGDTEP